MEFLTVCDELGISDTNKMLIASLLTPLRDKSPVTQFHYLHSLRVGLLARQIGRFIHHEEKPLLFAGALHDLGKCQTPLHILGRTDTWSEEDQHVIEQHVMDGYRLLRGRFDFSAEIMLWHHRFQEHGYPQEFPPFLHYYRESMKLLIREYGRIVALADVYDALHRIDGKFGKKKELTGEEIKENMLIFNPDRKRLVLALYDADIFSI
mgnify:FL=1